MKIYKSEFGEVKEAEFIRHTPKGFRVLENWSGGQKHERTYFINSPNGSHRSFMVKSEAIEDAKKHIEDEKAKHNHMINSLNEDMEKLSKI